MNEEKQQIAIAEACGWTITQITVFDKDYDVAILPPGVSVDDEGAVWKYAGLDIPDYLNDLNAMSEVEKTMTEGQLECYYGWMAGDCVWHELAKKLVHAPAKKRAEAFLKTIGKWEE